MIRRELDRHQFINRLVHASPVIRRRGTWDNRVAAGTAGPATSASAELILPVDGDGPPAACQTTNAAQNVNPTGLISKCIIAFHQCGKIETCFRIYLRGSQCNTGLGMTREAVGKGKTASQKHGIIVFNLERRQGSTSGSAARPIMFAYAFSPFFGLLVLQGVR